MTEQQPEELKEYQELLHKQQEPFNNLPELPAEHQEKHDQFAKDMTDGAHVMPEVESEPPASTE